MYNFQKGGRQNEKEVASGKQTSHDHSVSVFERLRKEEPTALTTTQKVVRYFLAFPTCNHFSFPNIFKNECSSNI